MKNIILFKKNIPIWNLIFDSEIFYFNCLKHYLNSNFWFQYDILNLNSKRIIWIKNWYFLNPKISISIQKIINWL
jgi:hypothetical protein